MSSYPLIRGCLSTLFFNRGLVSRFPLAFALVASATFFSLSVILLATCILPAATNWSVATGETPNVPELREDRPVRIRKRPRRGEGRSPSTVRFLSICFHDLWS